MPATTAMTSDKAISDETLSMDYPFLLHLLEHILLQGRVTGYCVHRRRVLQVPTGHAEHMQSTNC